MSQPVLIKVYANISPAVDRDLARLQGACQTACPRDDLLFSLQKDLLCLSFEGIFFPVDDTLAAIKTFLRKDQTGKMDVLDLENWRLLRYIFANGSTMAKSAPLNNVLDYSGF